MWSPQQALGRSDLGLSARRNIVIYDAAVVTRQGLRWKLAVEVRPGIQLERARRVPPALNEKDTGLTERVVRNYVVVVLPVGSCPCAVCNHAQAEECHKADCQCCSEQCT